MGIDFQHLGKFDGIPFKLSYSPKQEKNDLVVKISWPGQLEKTYKPVIYV